MKENYRCSRDNFVNVNFYLQLFHKLYFYSFKLNLLALKAVILVLQKSLQEVFNKYCIVKYIVLIILSATTSACVKTNKVV